MSLGQHVLKIPLKIWSLKAEENVWQMYVKAIIKHFRKRGKSMKGIHN